MKIFKSQDIENVNIESQMGMVNPRELKSEIPIDGTTAKSIAAFREEIARIVTGKDRRLLLIVGPCSIHDSEAAYDYAQRIKVLKDRYRESLCIVMRVYFEKPRTSLGWRGFVVDPDLDGSYKISKGLREARQLLRRIAQLGMPVGSEVLDPIIPQYISEFISWAAIGARTTESQTHRQIASGLSMPVGFKNGTDGDLAKAVNAIHSAQHPHSFIGIDQNGCITVFRTRGNQTGHIILRGGSDGPNYSEKSIELAEQLLAKIGASPSIIIDCSHANSGKRHEQQSVVFERVLDLKEKGNTSLCGVMLESNIVAGQQDIKEDLSALTYGQSITDACIGWEETEELLARAARCYNGLV